MSAANNAAPDCAGRNGAHTPTIGAVRVCDAREYGRESGYVVEQFDYWNQSEPTWAIPAWEERGLPELADTFRNESLALAAIAKAEGRS